ncbi:MAG: helix-turn-helix transcriptional regulator [Actinomycetota bacterium]|nr:helix-turn-helix transcriptional regulator [Actinomycetota bacterium]
MLVVDNDFDTAVPHAEVEYPDRRATAAGAPAHGALLTMLLVHTSQVLALAEQVWAERLLAERILVAHPRAANRATVVQDVEAGRALVLHADSAPHPVPVLPDGAVHLALVASDGAGSGAATEVRPSPDRHSRPGAHSREDAVRESRLSPREQELLGLVGRGLTDREIAAKLVISLATVRSHLDRIRDKTGRRRRPQLTRLAVDLDLILD